MSTLSSILRRLRTMPAAKLAKKLDKVVDEPRLLKPRAWEGSGRTPSEMAHDIQTPQRVRRKQMQNAQDYIESDGYQSTGYPAANVFEEGRIDVENVMALLRRLKQKGVQGIPPKKMVMNPTERRAGMMKKLLNSETMRKINEEMGKL